jgi:triosephosphate isomerase
MRKPIVAGNWKMHGSRVEAQSLLEAIKQGAGAYSAVEIAVMPSFVHLQQAQSVLANSPVVWGAQNLYIHLSGAFTGEVSGSMLADYGCHYVLVGHSERRAIFNEDLALVAAKFKAAQVAGLQPILCIGETLAQRESKQTEDVLAEQLESVIKAVGIESFRHAVIAYEPVWAIGTGLTATPDQAQYVHVFIRQLLMQHNVEIGSIMRILYGGSVKADNAAGLFAMPDIDGALVGGAALEAESFLKICAAFINL